MMPGTSRVTSPSIAMRIAVARQHQLREVAALRLALLEETGASLDAGERTALLEGNLAFFDSVFGSADWCTWVAEFDGQVGAIGTLALFSRPPYPGNPDGKDAYFLNMYTRPEFRGRGAAKALLQAAMRHAGERGVRKIVLHATEAGRPLYAAFGFRPATAYMELVLPPGEA
jgi:GNAT superfamily N-acetyltransferase